MTESPENPQANFPAREEDKIDFDDPNSLADVLEKGAQRIRPDISLKELRDVLIIICHHIELSFDLIEEKLSPAIKQKFDRELGQEILKKLEIKAEDLSPEDLSGIVAASSKFAKALRELEVNPPSEGSTENEP